MYEYDGYFSVYKLLTMGKKNKNNDIVIIPDDELEETKMDIINLDYPNIDNNEEPLFVSKKKNPIYRNLVLSGGSIKGISHIGAIKHMIDEKKLDLSKLKAVAGSSAGSITGTLIVLGFGPDDIWDFIYNLDFKKLVKPNILMLLKKCGIESGKTIYKLMENILEVKTGIKNINFKQLYEITNIHFTIVGSCLTTKEAIYYDHINSPLFSVSLAIRISIGMPGFFTPIIIDGKKYVDGAIMNNYPINIFKNNMEETLGIFIYSAYPTNYQYPEEYFMAIINLFMHNYYHKEIDNYRNNTIIIRETSDNLSIFNFDINNKVKKLLYEQGINAAKEFIIMNQANRS